MSVKPNLFIVGAMKSGTTSLYSILEQHPQICMSSEKEPSRFINENEIKNLELEFPRIYKAGYWKDHSKYLNLFQKEDRGIKYFGESSTAYAKFPLFKSPPKEIKKFNPNAKLIYILRNPVDRALSEYWHQVCKGNEHLTIDEAICENSNYLQTSNYPLQLSKYNEYFPPEQIKTILFEKFITDPESTIQDICQWLEIKNIPVNTKARNSSNELIPHSFENSIFKALATFIPPARKSQIKHLLFSGNNEKLRKTLGKKEAQVRNNLIILFEKNLPAWEKKLGKNLSLWKIK